MGNKLGKGHAQNRQTNSLRKFSKQEISSGHHEVEIFQGSFQKEAAESQFKWDSCEKNPGHEKFISAQDFKNIHLAKVQDVRDRERLRSLIDLTVRLRVNCTSRKRPDDDGLTQVRGTRLLRTGTGFIDLVYPPKVSKPRPCGNCGGRKKKTHWRFRVRTAHHVVYNTEEAEETKVDLFLDDESCDGDGGKKTMWGVKVLMCTREEDLCVMECVTCDEDLAEKIESIWYCYDVDVRRKDLDLSGLNLLPSCDRNCYLGLIVSHPHGQPKKITWGEWKGEDNDVREIYTVPTCPGSSGAPVFSFIDNGVRFGGFYRFFLLVHSGSDYEISTQHENQLNYGFWSILTNRTF